MRRSPAVAIAVAALAATLAPSAGWAEDAAAEAPGAPAADATPAPPSTPQQPSPAASPPPAGEVPAPAAAGADPAAVPAASADPGAAPAATPEPDAAAAAAAGLPLPGTGAALPEPRPAPPAPAPLAATPRRTLPLIGVSVGGGFPDLATASLLVRPIPWLRLFGGPCWSSLSWGVQGGVVVAPWSWYVTPTLSLQAGKLFGTNVTRYVKSDGGTAADLRPLLRDVDYRYLATDLGLELGSPRGFAFYLRLGLSFVVVKASGTATHTSDSGTRVTLSDPSVSAWLPSAKLGFQYWF